MWCRYREIYDVAVSFSKKKKYILIYQYHRFIKYNSQQ